MAGGIDWFRWHHGSVTDPKFQLVAKKAGVRLGDVIAVWAFVLEKASADTERGTIGLIDFETLDFLLGTEEGTSARILDAMSARGLIVGSRIARWEERQAKRERDDDTAAERKRRQREREEAIDASPSATGEQVTPCHAESHQTPPREEKSREEKKREEKGEVSDKPTRRPRGAKFAPDDFEVTPEMQAWAAEKAPLVDWRAETESFRDWEFKDARSDWEKVWRTWLRRAQKQAAERRKQPAQAQSFAKQDREAGMRRWEQMTGRVHPDRGESDVIDMQPQTQIGVAG